MTVVDINAGEYYLRPLRRDDRIDDQPELAALAKIYPDAQDMLCLASEVALRDLDERDEDPVDLFWAVCEQTEPILRALIHVTTKNPSSLGVFSEFDDEDFSGPVNAVLRYCNGALEISPALTYRTPS